MLTRPEHLMSLSVFMSVRIVQALVLSVFFLSVSIFVLSNISGFWSCRLFDIVTFLFVPLICYVGIFCFYFTIYRGTVLTNAGNY